VYSGFSAKALLTPAIMRATEDAYRTLAGIDWNGEEAA
jgi:hypothetical protein